MKDPIMPVSRHWIYIAVGCAVFWCVVLKGIWMSNFQWVVSPSVIAKGLEDYGKDAEVAIQAIGNYWGQMIQNDAGE